MSENRTPNYPLRWASTIVAGALLVSVALWGCGERPGQLREPAPQEARPVFPAEYSNQWEIYRRGPDELGVVCYTAGTALSCLSIRR